MIFNLISCILLIMSIVLLLDLNPERITSDLFSLTGSKDTLLKRSKALKTGKKRRSLGQRLTYTKDALEAMGQGDRFTLVICLSLILIALGAALAVLLKNPFLAPSFAAILGVMPFVYVNNALEKYKKHIRDELDTALSVITTSYERSENILLSVKENLNAIRPPLRQHFVSFINDATIINSSTTQAIRNLKRKVDNGIFQEWCDCLIQCEGDSTLKDTLQPVVSRLSDERSVNNELSVTMAAARMEYYTMVGMVVGNIPLLYILNKDWFHTLIFETTGKATLGVCGIVIFITYLLLLKFTKPIEYTA